jgi:hypothetical protein
VLAPYNILIGDGLHCPMLAAAEEFSWSIKFPGSSDFLTNAQPLFFPLGEHMAEVQVVTTTGTLSCTFFHDNQLIPFS